MLNIFKNGDAIKYRKYFRIEHSLSFVTYYKSRRRHMPQQCHITLIQFM